MIITGLLLLEDFTVSNPQARGPLDAWRAEVKISTWRTPQDVRNRYPRASVLSNNRVVFRIKGNDYRLLVKIHYQNGIVKIEWIGTHAEYDEMEF